MILVSVGLALLISIVQLIEIGLIIWLHAWISLESLTFEFFNDCLASSNRKAKKWQPSCNWAGHCKNTLLLLLLVAIGFNMGFIVWTFQLSLIKTLYIESIFVIVLVLMGGIGWICYDTIDQWPIIKGDRTVIEERMMASSSLRGALLESTVSGGRTTSLTSTTTTTTRQQSPNRGQGKTLKDPKGTFEMR